MSQIRYVSLFIIPALFFAGCRELPGNKASAPLQVVQGVATEQVAVSGIPETVEVAGKVQSRTSAAVLARIAGTISYIKVREGDRVRKGEVIARIESQESLSGATAALAAMEDAKQALAEAQSRKKLADATFERYQKLYQEQAITRQEFEIRQTEKELAFQSVARSEARFQQSQATSRAASVMADHTQIVAPVSGVIAAKRVDLGGTVLPGQPLFTIEDEAAYMLELAIPESLALKVRTGMPAEVTIDSQEGKFRGSVAEVVPVTDSASRSFSARINLPRKGVRSGMFGRAEIPLGSTVNGIFVPQKAVVERGALASLWVLNSEKTARIRLVKLGKKVGDRVEVLSGLSAGETIVVTGLEKLSEGVKVE